jgi:Flp pilus assembly protein TadG
MEAIFMNAFSRKKNLFGQRAQAIVEFAIALPILMALLVGIFEVGRMIFIYSAVTNASREASRFGSAIGKDDSGYFKYKYCAGIRNAANRSAFLVPLSSITIAYDSGPDTSSPGTCDAVSGEDADVIPAWVDSGKRVKVTVQADYRPMLRLLPLRQRTFTSISARTFLNIFELDN